MDFHSLMEHRTEAEKFRTVDDIRLTTLYHFHKLSRYHIQLAMILHNHNQSVPCLIFCDRALTSMLDALYIKTNNKPFPKRSFSMDELLHLLHSETAPALDMVIFIGTIQYLASNLEREQVSKMKQKNVNRLLRRTDEVLYLLSDRITDDRSKHYQSIF
ncbi:hypothetical protein [Paenibacillus jiagnxiensis]|uniref:hypothetical protein n=1 Tax=Paenibacillus jiagnxiensis TaxID=3228926 RepID=UPI0034936962